MLFASVALFSHLSDHFTYKILEYQCRIKCQLENIKHKLDWKIVFSEFPKGKGWSRAFSARRLEGWKSSPGVGGGLFEAEGDRHITHCQSLDRVQTLQ